MQASTTKLRRTSLERNGEDFIRNGIIRVLEIFSIYCRNFVWRMLLRKYYVFCTKYHCFDLYERFIIAPRRFRVTIGTETNRFKEGLIMEVMYPDGCPVLRMLDEGTEFKAECFLPNKSSRKIWDAIIKCWNTICIGMPNRMFVGQRTEIGDLFVRMEAEENVPIEKTTIESI